jgi:hypothetical protein
LYGTARPLAFIHASGLCHIGVGLDNIFLDEEFEPHLDGFFDGCLRKGTSAPELADDIWSFG